MKEALPPALRRPVENGAAIAWWQLGATREHRYDIADQPMSGEMDPFFFVTKHKNFIPHEYPCRTHFANERRGQRPKPHGKFKARRNWLPFGSPRVDLSGFWFRPTEIGTWARTFIEAEKGGAATLRLATCGGAILFVNGEETGWMAPYSRNLEADTVLQVMLNAGRNELLIWFDDLAERDARYYFQLDYVEGIPARIALPAGEDAATAEAIEAALASMHFEEPAYSRGEVATVFAGPIPADVEVRIGIEGDFMSVEHMEMHRRIGSGETRLAIGDTAELPCDFRHFNITMEANGFAASRVFGVEICHADTQGKAPDGIEERIGEALEWIAGNSETDTVRVIARLATGKTGVETEAMIDAALPAIEDCHDCADFILVPLLWSRIAFAGKLSEQCIDCIDRAVLDYRYWMDEPGNDVQWYFSENHALLFHTAAYLAGHCLPERTFRRSGRTGAQQSEVGAQRVRAWLDHFEKWEMAEFNSAPYFPIDLKGLTALYALAPDRDISERAGRAIIRLIEIVANSAHHGVLTGAQGRSYEHTLRAGRTLELSAIARMLWGKGNYGRRYHCLPQLALCIRDHGLEMPAELSQIAFMAAGTAQEWCFAQGQESFARLYHHKSADHAMGSAAAYRWDQWGYQETVLHLRIGRNPDAQVWINQPGEVIHSGYARPSYWGGSATLPRAWQYRDLALLDFRGTKGQPPLTHAWFPQHAFDAVLHSRNHSVASSGKGMVLLKGSGPLQQVTTGPTAGNELRQEGLASKWLVRVGSTDRHGDIHAFAARFGAIEITVAGDGFVIEDPEYGEVRFNSDGTVEAEQRQLVPQGWTVAGSRVNLPEGPLDR
jgi:hypothetical protein